MATVVTKTIGASGRDYATIQAFLTACPADLVAADQIWEGVIYPDGGNTYSEAVLVTGTHTTDSTRYIRLKAAPGASFMDNAGKLTNALRANAANGILLYLGPSATNNVLTASCHLELVGLQIKNAASGSYYGITHSSRLTLRNCIVEAQSIAINGPASQAALFAYNSILISQYRSVYNGGTVSNSTLKGCTIAAPSGTAQKPFVSDYMKFLLVDCAWFGYTVLPTAGSGFTVGSSGNTTDQSSFPTNVTGTTGLVYADQFVGTGITGGTHDLRPKAGNGLGVGTTDAELTLDIVGQTRAATPTSGAFEYVSAGGALSGAAAGTATASGTANASLNGPTGLNAAAAGTAVASGTANAALDGGTTGLNAAASGAAVASGSAAATLGTVGTITVPELSEFETGNLLTGVSGITAWVNDEESGVLVAKVTGLSSHAVSADIVIQHAAIVPLTAYSVRTRLPSGAQFTWTYTAS